MITSKTYALLNRPIYLPARTATADKDLFVGCTLNLRLFHGIPNKVHLSRVNRADIWFLTKDDKIQQCNFEEANISLSTERSFTMANRRSTHVFMIGVSDDNIATALVAKPSAYSMDIVFNNVRLGAPPPDEWGYYRAEALDKQNWDSDYFLTWNITGACITKTPDFFRVAPPQHERFVSADFVAAIVRDAKRRPVAVCGDITSLILPKPMVAHRGSGRPQNLMDDTWTVIQIGDKIKVIRTADIVGEHKRVQEIDAEALRQFEEDKKTDSQAEKPKPTTFTPLKKQIKSKEDAEKARNSFQEQIEKKNESASGG